MEPHQVAVKQGWQWLVDGFALFRKNPLIWVVLCAILVAISYVLIKIPFLGMVLNLILPVLVGGLMLGCQSLQNGGELEIAHLFACFRKNPSSLIALGGVNLVGIILIAFVVVLIGGQALDAVLAGDQGNLDMAVLTTYGNQILLALLVGLALYVPLAMALWLSPVLVALRDTKAMVALKLSFIACLKNILPFLVYGVIVFILQVIIALLLGIMNISFSSRFMIALVVMLPVLIPTLYISYKDIFSDNSIQTKT
ncbi:MAG TPA: BPSS1780 family membrane protein [Burkholderiales bacterium]|nr:BPSS1780 family membrane protein [Burkholderiales bacterium]